MHGHKRLPGLENQELRVKDLLRHANSPRPTAATTHTTNTTLRLLELLNSHNNTFLAFIPVSGSLQGPLSPAHMHQPFVCCQHYIYALLDYLGMHIHVAPTSCSCILYLYKSIPGHLVIIYV